VTFVGLFFGLISTLGPTRFAFVPKVGEGGGVVCGISPFFPLFYFFPCCFFSKKAFFFGPLKKRGFSPPFGLLFSRFLVGRGAFLPFTQKPWGGERGFFSFFSQLKKKKKKYLNWVSPFVLTFCVVRWGVKFSVSGTTIYQPPTHFF